MAGKTLKIELILPVREEYTGLSDIIGVVGGWSLESGITPTDFAQDPVIKKEMVNQLKIIIQRSLQTYYGLSQDALIKQASLDYDNSIVCNVSFTDNEE